MNATELQRALKKRIQELKRKRIWQKAMAAAVKYGQKTFSYPNGQESIGYDAAIALPNSRALEIKVCTDKEQKCHILIEILGADYKSIATVFEAFEIGSPLPPKVSGLIALIGRRKKILVRSYIPGKWEKCLNLRTFGRLDRELRQRLNRRADKIVRRINRGEIDTLTKKQKKLAALFGIRTGNID